MAPFSAMAHDRDDKLVEVTAGAAHLGWRTRLIQYANPIAVGLSVLMHAGLVYLGRSTVEHAVIPRRHGAEVQSQVYLGHEAPAPEIQKPDRLPPSPEAPLPEPSLPSEPRPVMERASVPIAPTELIAVPPPVARMRSDGFGEITGERDATALHSLDGDEPMRARLGERDQAPLDRVIQEQTPESPPAEQVAPVVDAMQGHDSKREPQLQEIAEQNTVEAKPGSPADPALPGEAPPETEPVEVALSEARETRATDEQPVVRSVSPQSLSQKDPRSAEVQRRPGASATSDSDAFSTEGATEFRPGKVTAAFGRRVKTVRPKLTLAGQYDLLGMAVPKVVLDLRVDETGRVRHVSIAQSSGSSQIDEACELAMYEWWFEPPRSSTGEALPCELRWTISFRR